MSAFPFVLESEKTGMRWGWVFGFPSTKEACKEASEGCAQWSMVAEWEAMNDFPRGMTGSVSFLASAEDGGHVSPQLPCEVSALGLSLVTAERGDERVETKAEKSKTRDQPTFPIVRQVQ